MKRLIKFFVLLSMVVLVSSIGYSTEKAPEKVEITNGVYLEHNTIPYPIDRLFVVIAENDNVRGGKEYKEIFKSEGNPIKQVLPLDIDSDGKSEYLVSMYTGGSGNFYDIAIIKEKEDKWASIWEGSFSSPEIQVTEQDGKYEVQIDTFVKITDNPQKTSILLNYENDAIVKTDLSSK